MFMPKPAAPFHCKQFSMYQDRCAMKVGTDGMLLGAWAPVAGAGRILDIGTGTGLLALMLAQRAPKAQLDALEIDPVAAQQAQENAAASPFAARIAVHAQALQTWSPPLPYDLIVGNPPYFTAGMLPPDAARLQARHAHSLDLPTLLQQTTAQLSPAGQAAFIFPHDQWPRWQEQAKAAGLFSQRVCVVQPTPYKPPHRVLLTLGRQPAPLQPETLTIRAAGGQGYTAAYRALTKDFYVFG